MFNLFCTVINQCRCCPIIQCGKADWIVQSVKSSYSRKNNGDIGLEFLQFIGIKRSIHIFMKFEKGFGKSTKKFEMSFLLFSLPNKHCFNFFYFLMYTKSFRIDVQHTCVPFNAKYMITWFVKYYYILHDVHKFHRAIFYVVTNTFITFSPLVTHIRRLICLKDVRNKVNHLTVPWRVCVRQFIKMCENARSI